VAAVILAALLYAGLVATQDSNTYPGPVPVLVANQPTGTIVTNQLKPVEQIRYLAPVEVGRLTADDFLATVDLAGLTPTGKPVSVRVVVEPVDPRVTIIEIRPRTVQVILDASITVTVPVRVDSGDLPAGIDAGETTFTPEQVTVSGASAAVKRVVAAQITISLDPGGIDFDRSIQPDAVDAEGEVVTGVDVSPRLVHVTIPLFTDKESRTLPINPVVTGAPAPGFRIVGVEVTPLVVSVEGDAEQLTTLLQADTAPVAVFGATRDVSATVTLALPPGVIPLGAATVTVVVKIEAVTETRTFGAGVRLDGREAGLRYAIDDGAILLTLFGPVADLDRLAAAPIVVGVSVAGLAPGTHEIAVVPALPSGVTIAAIAPGTVTVTITVPPTPSPAPTAAPPTDAPPTDRPSPTAAP
jgi:YbbR domain-containing protein